MLLFKKKFLEQIRRGEKTQTIRLWPHRKLRPGQRSYIPHAGYIEVQTVEAVELESLNDDDARHDGFVCVDDLRAEISALYPDGLSGGLSAYRIRFRVLTPAEQAAAIAEKERRKQTQ